MSGPIVVDTSAVVAVLWKEPAEAALRRALNDAESRAMSAASIVELGMVVVGRLDEPGHEMFEGFLLDSRIDVVPLDHGHAHRALMGFERYGKGRHPAGLNLGDCFTYGLAKTLGAPILCIGDDFAKTDVEVVPLG